jgi:prophage regulatory protein
MSEIKDEPRLEIEGEPRLRRTMTEDQVLQAVGFSGSTLYRREKAGRFPKSTYISPNRRIWYEDEVIAWQNTVDEFDPKRRRGKWGARAKPLNKRSS